MLPVHRSHGRDGAAGSSGSDGVATAGCLLVGGGGEGWGVASRGCGEVREDLVKFDK
jgi:hypothetical protein